MTRYNEDLDYLIIDADITGKELEEIIREADSILSGQGPDEEQKITALLKRTQVLQKLEKYDESREYVERILELKPEMPQALVRLGNIYDVKKEHDKALDCITRSININKEYPYAYCMRGVMYDDMGEYDKAVEDYNRAIELKPDFADAYSNRGNAYTGLGEHGKAVEDFNRAIELKPDVAMAYNNRGNAYAGLGEHGKAIEDYNRAVELKPDFAMAYYNRGTAYFSRRKHGKAVADYSRAIELKPDFAEAYHNRSVLFYIEGEYDKAFQAELKCLKYIQNSQDYDISAKIQRNVGSIIKNSGNPDFIWNSTKDGNELERVPNFFFRIIGSFIKEGFAGKKYKDLVNAVIELWKGCYGVDHERDEAVILYHYTSMTALRAMFKSQCLRLSPASYLNDPNEGKTVFTYLKESAKTKELEAYLEKVQEEEAKSEDIIFIRSFTDKEDNLVMWNSSYADNGRGVSIGIPALLVNKGQGTPEPAGNLINADISRPDTGKQKDQPIPLELIGLFKIKYDRDCVKKIADCLNKFDEGDFSNDKLTELTARLFVPVAALVKNEDYQHESEYRLVYIASRAWEDDVLMKYIKQTPEDGVYLETEKVLFERFDKFEDDYPCKEYVGVYIGPRVDKIVCLKCFDSFRSKYPNVKIEPSGIEWQ
jgi:tetratricopeptide (TPR) repeat protein